MKSKSITKNSAYLIGSSIIQKILYLIYFVLIARAFGPHDQGMYSTAIAFCNLFTVFIDFGAAAVLTREIARDRTHAGLYLGQVIFFRSIVGVLTYGGILVSALLAGYSHELRFLIALAGIAIIFDMISTAQWAAFRGFQNFMYEAGAVVGVAVLLLLTGGTAVILGQPLWLLVSALVFVSICHVTYAMILLKRSHITVQIIPQIKILKTLLLFGAPFAGAAIFSRIYTNADITLLARFAGEVHAGWYSAANKIILALQFVPAAISGAMYPAMSRYAINDIKRLGDTFVHSIYLLLLLVLPLACGTFLLSDQIVKIFYGDRYLPTIAILQILSGALVFAFLIFPLGVLLAATNKQSVNTAVLAGAALFNFLGNILLIRSIGAYGSAWVSTFTYGAIFCVEMIVTWKYWKDQDSYLCDKIFKILCATCIMGFVVFFVKSSLPFFITVILAVCVYGVSAIVFRLMTKNEIDFFLRSFTAIRKPVD